MDETGYHAGHNIIVIGTSMGGIEALTNLLSQLPANFPAPILVVMHTHPSSPQVINQMIGKKAAMKVKFAEDDEVPCLGTVYLAPSDRHLLLEEKRMVLSRDPQEKHFRPAINTLFRSAAATHTTHVIGVLLTGLLSDGTAGLQSIKDFGGIAVVQDPADAAFPDMPQNAMNAVKVDYCIRLKDMGALLMKLVATPA